MKAEGNSDTSLLHSHIISRISRPQTNDDHNVGVIFLQSFCVLNLNHLSLPCSVHHYLPSLLHFSPSLRVYQRMIPPMLLLLSTSFPIFPHFLSSHAISLRSFAFPFPIKSTCWSNHCCEVDFCLTSFLTQPRTALISTDKVAGPAVQKYLLSLTLSLETKTFLLELFVTTLLLNPSRFQC